MTQVLIIGGGIGGLCLAQGLKKSGIDATVFDRDPDPRFRAQGWRLSLKEDGIRALRECLPQHLFDLCLATALQPATKLAVTDHQLTPKFVKPIPPQGIGVNRLTLREILLIDLNVRFGKTFRRFDQQDAKVRAHFADGTEATGDLLVGADGTNSVVRNHIAPHAVLDDLGTMIYGRTPDRPLPDILDNSFNNLVSPNGVSFGVATCRANKELTDIPDYLAWTVRGWPGGKLPATAEALHALATDCVRDFHPAVREIVAEADIPVTFPVTLRAARPIQWHTTNITLLGDAVHTMPPSRGEGANTTLRDALLLRDALAELPLHEAKARYEKEMLDYGFRMVAQSVQEPFMRRVQR